VQKLLIRLESAGRNEVEEAITNIIEHAHKSTDKV
jgi:anti-sigma regulatory factor (Ser/Thr protein kinase)